MEKEMNEGSKKGQKLLFNGGIALLVCLAVGMGFSFLFDVSPPELSPEDLKTWKLGLGFGYSIVLYFFPLTWLLIKYFRGSRAK